MLGPSRLMRVCRSIEPIHDGMWHVNGSWVILVFPGEWDCWCWNDDIRFGKASVADVLHPDDPMDAVHGAVGEWICDQEPFTSDGAVVAGLIFPVH